MTGPLHYEPHFDPHDTARDRAGALAKSGWWPGAIALAAGCVVAAGCAWARSTPSLGERALAPVAAWTARSAAISLWAAGHAVLLGVALPALYRPRPVYAGLAACSGLVATLAAISAGALWLAGN